MASQVLKIGGGPRKQGKSVGANGVDPLQVLLHLAQRLDDGLAVGFGLDVLGRCQFMHHVLAC